MPVYTGTVEPLIITFYKCQIDITNALTHLSPYSKSEDIRQSKRRDKMNGASVKVPECKALLDDLATRTYGIFYVSGWELLVESSEGGVKLSARSTTGGTASVDVTDSELMSKLRDLADEGVGYSGADHKGVEFRFERYT
jgi:hypothetical protein